MRKILPLAFALFISASPSFSWGWGDCPHSKQGASPEASSEEVEESESSKQN